MIRTWEFSARGTRRDEQVTVIVENQDTGTIPNIPRRAGLEAADTVFRASYGSAPLSVNCCALFPPAATDEAAIRADEREKVAAWLERGARTAAKWVREDYPS